MVETAALSKALTTAEAGLLEKMILLPEIHLGTWLEVLKEIRDLQKALAELATGIPTAEELARVQEEIGQLLHRLGDLGKGLHLEQPKPETGGPFPPRSLERLPPVVRRDGPDSPFRNDRLAAFALPPWMKEHFPWLGQDEGRVGQGVAVGPDGRIYVSTYLHKGDSTRVDVYGPDGTHHGHFDLPKDVNHAGGLTFDREGKLLVSDTKVVYRIDTAQALKDGSCNDAILARRDLDGIRGSTIAYDPNSNRIFIGEWAKGGPGQGHFFDAEGFFDADGALTTKDAAASISLPSLVQGAAFRDGQLWISRSTTQFGELLRVDAVTGQILERGQTLPGMEDLAFDKDGKLWSLSEAGAERYPHSRIDFSQVFSLDTAELPMEKSTAAFSAEFADRLLALCAPSGGSAQGASD